MNLKRLVDRSNGILLARVSCSVIAITGDAQKPTPWTFLYIDDVMLSYEGKNKVNYEEQTLSDHLALLELRKNVKQMLCMSVDSNGGDSSKIDRAELLRLQLYSVRNRVLRQSGL
ncbi:unnamed protein product [Haemonchus placei]|uniref:Reverse transcriptase domain-containing protein n=1 Tax=Haemonchus placei TaxID=6290 RepID=A0A0N4X2R9_HAEPC|nr:unnamed protein product [Haemonchus placei]